MFTSWSEVCSLAVLQNLVPSVSVFQHRHSQVEAHSLNLWRNKLSVLLYAVLFLWGPIKGKVIHNIQGHNSRMYDTPRYNQLKIIGIYAILQHRHCQVRSHSLNMWRNYLSKTVLEISSIYTMMSSTQWKDIKSS